MVTHVDDKGKYFTPVITKTPVPVIIQMPIHRIEGNIHIRPDERLKDEVDRPEPFLSVTEAVIYNSDGTIFASTHFIALNRNQINWILPVDEMINQT
jgi:hypothetical protein